MQLTRRRSAVIAAAALLVLVATSAVVLLARRPAEPPPAAQPSVRTVTVQRADLANTTSLPATIGFGPARAVKGTGTGTVTKLPDVGAIAECGKALYRVDDQPVPVFFGATPLFRKIEAPGTKGSDVAVVVENLAALGYRGVGSVPKDATKAEYTPGLIDAVKRWQREPGVEATGAIEPGRLLVLGGPVRVATVKAQPGVPVTEELFEVTSTNRLVTAQVPPADAGQAKPDQPVTVVRPDGREVPGKIRSVTPLPPAQDGPGTAKVEIAVVLEPAEVADLETAPVQVKITTESRTGVLTVPLEALVALKEGGYAVQLPRGELKAVQTGLYSQNKVEISGADVADGLQVVAAR